jgi:hypothetical protein
VGVLESRPPGRQNLYKPWLETYHIGEIHFWQTTHSHTSSGRCFASLSNLVLLILSASETFCL